MNYAGEFRPINVTGFDVNFGKSTRYGRESLRFLLIKNKILGAGHGLDAKFYNDGSLIGAKSLNKDEEKMKDILLDMLVTFAKTGLDFIFLTLTYHLCQCHVPINNSERCRCMKLHAATSRAIN